jgi:hypothetical protein
MVRIAIAANLFAYSIVVSQPLAYALFLSRAQRALSAAAYIELRQCINRVMNRRLPAVYATAFATSLVSLLLAIRLSSWSVLITAALALLCLVLDVILMLRASLPINGILDRWSTTNHPENWADYRERWFAVFAYRQAVLLIGFLGLLLGAGFRS